MQERRALEQQVLAFCRPQSLLGTPQAPLALCAAVSGGADSMALLRLLRALAPECGFRLTACHVNHGLRGATADADEAFVRQECAALGVELRVFHPEELPGFLPIPPHAGEDWARRLRYACFAQLLAEGIDRVATAHTVNDQAETLLFRLCRGTGLRGAGGIPVRREGFVRPLLCLTRHQTEEYCRLCGQVWVTDETNLLPDYARNRLRRQVLPVLQEVNSSAVPNLARFCEKAARADAFFERQAVQLLQAAAETGEQRRKCLPQHLRRAAEGRALYSLELLQEAEDLILERGMQLLLDPVRDTEETPIQLLCALVRRGTGAVQLTESVCARAEEGAFFLQSKPACRSDAAAHPGEDCFDFCPEKRQEYPMRGGWMVQAALNLPKNSEKIQLVHKKDLKYEADYDKIIMRHSALQLRTRRGGDSFRPAGRGVTKSLRKLFGEAEIPPALRDTLPLLAEGSRVIWLAGFGFAEGYAPTEETRRRLYLAAESAEF